MHWCVYSLLMIGSLAVDEMDAWHGCAARSESVLIAENEGYTQGPASKTAEVHVVAFRVPPDQRAGVRDCVRHIVSQYIYDSCRDRACRAAPSYWPLIHPVQLNLLRFTRSSNLDPHRLLTSFPFSSACLISTHRLMTYKEGN